jgi:hypothetical protein
LDNTELHKRIAENINKAIHKPVPGETSENVENVPSSNTAGEADSAEIYPVISGPNPSLLSCDGMLQELNQTIKTIVDQTEQDPVFERFLEEIIGITKNTITTLNVWFCTLRFTFSLDFVHIFFVQRNMLPFFNLGYLYPVACVRSGDGGFYICLRSVTKTSPTKQPYQLSI